MITQVDKHVPMHLRRKNKLEKAKPRHFEIMPPTGTLMPGQRLNVQVKFMPTEEVRHVLICYVSVLGINYTMYFVIYDIA